ncbi:MAG TPA: glycosyltransferase family 2 protein [Candidatus Poseidoniales archaeon]|jgi:glycosyltransferase involved in cell wall biosynthesis|nr:MAG: dolichyl-phosphate mannose synthase [Euryarchaeota archaeon]HIG03479.1 glycosyltransferase family 2 protein [Candidatus Poseidoniales archaeon]HIK78953.1 glycosyltransferase family 2 protein [Candidatus Poseidoniales archaeon]
MGDGPEVDEVSSKPLIVAGMPMYNEEETIGTIVRRTLRHVDTVLCIDDGSSDSSAHLATRCGAQVTRHRVNRGYGGALKTLFVKSRQMGADILITLDSDGQHDPNDIPKIIEPILSGEADIVIGSRFIDGGTSVDMPAYRRLGIKVITAASNLSSDLNIKDTQSGFRAFSAKALELLRFDCEGMELSLEILEDANEKELKVAEIPTVIRYDVPKGSRFTALSHGFTVLAYALITLSQKKPLIVLGIPGFGLLATGAAMGLRAIDSVGEFTDGTIGPGITAAWIGVLGLSLIATGLVLQSARSILKLLIVKEFGID